jgi:hypothetical protein
MGASGMRNDKNRAKKILRMRVLFLVESAVGLLKRGVRKD